MKRKMYGIFRVKRYTRIKRCVLAVVVIGMHLNLTTSKYGITGIQPRRRTCLFAFVRGGSTNTGSGSYGHATTKAPDYSSSSSTSQQKDGNDSIVVSNVLQRHRAYYNNRFPHNRYVYDILQVPYNATIQQIQQSYRTLSRIYHPDKRNTRRKNSSQQQPESENDEITLRRIRSAYDLLKNDTKRFLYHRHGILHSTQEDVVSILYPFHNSHRQLPSSILSYDPQALEQLHELMGYNFLHGINERSSLSWLESDTPFDNKEGGNEDSKIEDRALNVMLFLIEQIRPMFESASSHTYEQYMDQELMQRCDRIKVLPLGPSILRCIGRAYRYEGKRIVRHLKLQSPRGNNILNKLPVPCYAANYETNVQYDHHQQQHLNTVAIRDRPISQYLLAMDRVRHAMRHVKHLSIAAIAGSRVYIQERRQQNRDMPHRRVGRDEDKSDEKSNDNHYDDELVFGDDSDIIADSDNNQQSNHNVHGISTDVAMLESLQIDALWKIYKIELDSIVRKACRRILVSLQDQYQNVFLPSHVSDMMYNDNNNDNDPRHQPTPINPSSHSRTSEKYDGWIVTDTSSRNGPTFPILSSSSTIPRQKLLLRQHQQLLVANAFIRMGNILIERSKVGTSWME